MRRLRFLLVPVVLIAILGVFSFPTLKSDNKADFNSRYAVYSLKTPSNMTFADEKIPVEFFDVREGLDKELHINTYWQSQTIFLIKRANRYFPTIEKILIENGIPTDFKYLAVAESGLTNALSPSNAAGFWQFLKQTGKDYSLEINDQVDERYNLEKSTAAACEFLIESYKKFGSWTMAAASYNMGRDGLSKQVIRQRESNYYDLLLNEETARYVYRILAIKLIIENPDLYGFHIPQSELYPPFQYTEVKVDSSITDIALFAKQFNTNYKILKTFNPWLRDNMLENKTKNLYLIKIPPAGFRENLYAGYLLENDSLILNK
jgi:membrane-bound lytic murein transglycosylase D